MKKMIAFVFALVCVFGMVGCSTNNIDTAKPIFRTENISRITVFCIPDHLDGIEVPTEYMEEIITWIGTFRIDKKAGDVLEPGANTSSFRIEYSDGTIVESGVNTTTIDGVTYYMKCDKAPACYDALFDNTETTE